MSYRGFDFEKNAPLFRPPKYTGITLSLLSIFVLVCMLAVWEKMVPINHQITLAGYAWKDCQEPLELSRVSFQQETGIHVEIQYFEESTLLQANMLPDSIDFMILPTANDDQTFNSSEMWAEKIPLAFQASNKQGSMQGEKPLVGWIAQNTASSVNALLFNRYLSAPSRGQFDFATKGWVGVKGDRWTKSPNLQMFLPTKMQQLASPIFNAFKLREGVSVNAQFFDQDSMLKALRLTSQSQSKKYLPDLVWISSNAMATHFETLPFTSLGNHGVVSLPKAYLCQWSNLQQTAERFHHFASKSI